MLDDDRLIVVVMPMVMRMADHDNRIGVGRRNGEAEHGQGYKRQNKLTHCAFSLKVFSDSPTIREQKNRSGSGL
jgi:hypothetical protein